MRNEGKEKKKWTDISNGGRKGKRAVKNNKRSKVKEHERRGERRAEGGRNGEKEEGSSPAPLGLTSCLIILDLCNQRKSRRWPFLLFATL